MEFVGRDATLWGFEAHGDVKFTEQWTAEFTFDLVRGTLSDTDENLPRMPPYRGIVGLRYQNAGFQAGTAVTMVAEQDRVYGEELPTDGYATLRLYGAYSFTRVGCSTHYRSPGECHQRALPESPELSQGPASGNGPELQARLYDRVLVGCGRVRTGAHPSYTGRLTIIR